MCPSGGEQKKCTASGIEGGEKVEFRGSVPVFAWGREREWENHPQDTRLGSNHDLLIIGSIVYRKSSALEHVIIESASRMDVDDMLSHAGDFGRYQIFLMALFCIINVLSAFHYFSQTIISVVPEHRCRDTDTLQEAENISLGNCVSGWDYNLTHGFQSIISEFDWVGDDDWKPALGQSLFFVGSVIGTLGLGVMADHIGRLPVLVLANLLALVGNLATAFTSGLPQFASCRLLAGLATDSNFLMMYILVMEYMRPNMRTLGLNLCIGVFYSLGCVVVPWVAVLTMNWRHFLLVVSTPLVVVPAYYLLVPESARWLINKGRTDEAVTCFLRIAKFNGRNIPSSVIDTFKIEHSSRKVSDKSPNLLGLFATPRLRRKTCILIFKS
uniref:Major facilitator superfamily (MFS) profile domain-containing protein n=1 Tax=Timema bartmani TaxID=61472 RepID=A0A7R9F330_9NEOP|nr:unnamed protein product [Timema bartmani]